MGLNYLMGLTLFCSLLCFLSAASIYYSFLDKREVEKFALLDKKIKWTIGISLLIGPLLSSLGILFNFSKAFPLIKLLIPLLLIIYFVPLTLFFYRATKRNSSTGKRFFLLTIVVLSFLILLTDAMLFYLIFTFNKSIFYYSTIVMLTILTLFLSFAIVHCSRSKIHLLNSSG